MLQELSVHHAKNQCTFTQDCFQTGVDTECTPRAYEDSESKNAFPMNESSGFGVKHEMVWDGSMANPSSGLCASGKPDIDGRCIQKWDNLLDPIAPVMCPQYKDLGCCTWQQNYALYQNLRSLVDSFGGATGCLACATNLVNLWCALICSPNQSSFLTLHNPPRALIDDDLTGISNRPVLQADILLDASYACDVFSSCSGTAIVGASTAMQSAVGLLQFQLQTGAVGHGEYFFLSFDGKYPSSSNGQTREEKKNSLKSGFQTEVLQCDSFWDPGSLGPPFPFPPPKETISSCSCGYCKAACSNQTISIIIDPSSNPIPVMNGFDYSLVIGFYFVVAILSTVIVYFKRPRT